MSTSKHQTSVSTDQSSSISSNELDDAVNFAYNVFSAESLRHYRGVPAVKLNRNFKYRKTDNPAEWEQVIRIVQMCREKKFHLQCYIKYCMLNRLAKHKRGQMVSDIYLLLKFPQIAAYERDKANIEKLYLVYMSIMKTIFKLKAIKKNNNLDAKGTIKKVLASHNLSTMISTGEISKFFLTLIPNCSSVLHNLMKYSNDDKTVIHDLCATIDQYKPTSIESIKMFYPDLMKKNIVTMLD